MHHSFITLLLTLGRQACVRLSQLLRASWRQLQRWWELAEQRRKLALLDEYALHDLGLSRADALCESERPFWDDPLRPADKPANTTRAHRASANGRRLL